MKVNDKDAYVQKTTSCVRNLIYLELSYTRAQSVHWTYQTYQTKEKESSTLVYRKEYSFC